jgi:hypothetical protein
LLASGGEPRGRSGAATAAVRASKLGSGQGAGGTGSNGGSGSGRGAGGAESNGRPRSGRVAAGRAAGTGGPDRFDLLAAAGLAALAWIFYSPALGLWWTNDDFFQLHFVLVHPPLSYAWQPAVWRELPFQMVTPLLFASFDLDLSLFGLAPHGFYLHQLLVVCLLGAAFHLLLRLWLSRWAALAGAFLLLAGPPVVASVGVIMVRHYLEGALLAVVSTALYVHAVRVPRPGPARLWAALSAVLYLLAALAKEIFVPLVLVLLALPEVGWRERLRRAGPHLAALAAYLGYRVFMLGELVGGYGWVVRPRELPRLALALPGRLLADLAGGAAAGGGVGGGGGGGDGGVGGVRLGSTGTGLGGLHGGPALGWAALVLLAAAAVAGLILRRRARLPVAVGALAAVGPILPVSTEVPVRYALAFWILLVAAAVAGIDTIPAHGKRAARLAAALAVLSCCVAGWAARAAWARSLGELERMSVENRFFAQLPAGLLRNPLGPGSSLSEMGWWKRELFGLPTGARWSYDDVLLCTQPAPLRGVRGMRGLWTYDRHTRTMAEVSAALPRICRRALAALRPQAPLRASFEETAAEQLFWSLGPYPEGKYSFLLAGGAVLLPVPRATGYRTHGTPAISLQLRYESPEGWVTYSPVLDLDLSHPMKREWRRGGVE